MPDTIEEAFEIYLHDIHDLPLLDQGDEQRLVVQMLAGRQAAQRLWEESHLPDDERKHLEQTVTVGQQARDALVAAHLRLVIRIARQYTSRGVSLLDLIQEGNLGLLQAVEHFDPQYGVRFATYAIWWIRHAIARAIAEAGHLVHLPDEVRSKLYQLYRARNELLQQLGREPNEAEIGQAVGLPTSEVRLLSQYLQPVLSLNVPLNEEHDDEQVDVVPDPIAELQLSEALQDALAEELEHLLQHLNEEERWVLALRFGLHGQRLRSRQEVAGLLGMTSERVRRIEARALRKLRTPELLQRLQEYIDQ
jgi:RNA polymerase primary sigma factor